MASKLCFTFRKQMVSIRCSFGICRSGLYTAKAIHTSAAHSAVVKSKWHEKIPDDVSVYDFVTKSISTNPEKNCND